MSRCRHPYLLGALLLLLASCGGGTEDAPEYSDQLPLEGEEQYLVLFGDPQRTGLPEQLLLREQNDSARAEVLRAVAAARPDLVVLLGDMVFRADDDEAWEHFDRVMQPLRKSDIPVFPLLGNHEYFGNDENGRREIDRRFPPLRDRDWYALRYGGLELLFINSNFDDMDPEAVEAQLQWYRERLRALDEDEEVRQVLVCSHHPPFTNSMIVSPSEVMQNDYLPPFLESRKATMLFSGHCHSYEHFRIGDKHLVVTGGAGGPRQELDRCWRRTYNDLYQGADVRPFHYCALRLRGDTLRMTVHMLSADMQRWTVGDSLQVVAPAAALAAPSASLSQ